MKDLVRRRESYGLVFGAALLLILSPITSTAFADDGKDKPKTSDLVATNSAATPAIISPANADGRFDTSTLSAHFSIKPKDGLEEGDSGEKREDEKRFELRVKFEVRGGNGAVVRTLQSVSPVTPLGKKGKKEDDEKRRIELDFAAIFDGQNAAGALLADGSYAVGITGQVVRIQTREKGKEQRPPNEKIIATSTEVTTTVRIDNTPPAFVNARPPANGFTTERRPVIAVLWSDAGAGIDVASGGLTVDGSSVTGASMPSGITFTPTTDLAGGGHAALAAVSDAVGNATSFAWTFREAEAGTAIGSEGGAVTVTNPASPLQGASVTLPPGSAPDGTLVTIEERALIAFTQEGYRASGPQVFFNAGGIAFAAPVTISVPYDPAQVRGDPGHVLALFQAESAISPWILVPNAVVDPVTHLLTATVATFSYFEVAYIVDTVPPSITNLRPAPDSFQNTPNPDFTADLSDATTGVNPSSGKFTLNGVDVPAVFAETGVTFTPSSPLPEGVNTAIVSVADWSGNVATATWSHVQDYTPPALSTFPVANQFVPTATPQITLSYTDLFSGVDTTTLRLSVDGVDVTATTAIEPERARFTVQPSAPVFDGNHTLSAQVADRVGNLKHVDVAFRVDTSFPTLRISPAGGERIGTGTPTITLDYSDVGSGIDLNSLRMELDGRDVANLAARTATAAALGIASDAPLTDGEHTLNASIADHAGNVTPATIIFFVAQPFAVTIPAGAPPAAHSVPAGEPSTLSISVVDAAGAGISGILVHFQILTGSATLTVRDGSSVTSASPSAPLTTTTDQNGTATVTLTPNGTSPIRIVTTFPENSSLAGPTFEIQVLPGRPGRIQIGGIPAITQVGVIHSPTITVFDVRGNPSSTFSGMLRIDSPSTDLNGDGYADSLLVYFPESPTGSLTLNGYLAFTHSGPARVTVKTVEEPFVFGIADIEILPGPPATAAPESGGDQVVGVGASSAPLTVRIADRFGNAPSSVTVLFRPTLGSATFVTGDPKLASAMTDASGKAASPALVTSLSSSVSLVEATLPDFPGVAVATFRISTTGVKETTSPTISFLSPTQYQVIKSADVPVSIAVTDGKNSGGISPAGVRVVLDATDLTGALSITSKSPSDLYIAGTLSTLTDGPHLLEVVATDLNLNKTRARVEFTTAQTTTGPVATLVKVTGDGQSASPGTTLTKPFVVRALDDLGQPSPGQQVRFAVKTEAPLDYRQVGNLSLARSHFAGVLLPPTPASTNPPSPPGTESLKYLVIDGLNGGEASFAVDAIDLNKGTAKNIGRTVVPRYDHAAVLLPGTSGRVLITGGVNAVSGADERTAEVFDAATGTSTVVGQMLEARRGQQMLVLDADSVLIFGGSNTANTEIFQVSTGTFSYGPPLSTARRYFAATGFATFVDVGGGMLMPRKRLLVTGGSPDGSAESFDYETRTFSPAGTMTRVRSRHAAATISMLPGWTTDRVLITGGSNSKIEDTAEIYDPATGTFTNIGPMADGPRAQHVAVSGGAVNGSVALLGGISSVGADGTPVVRTSIEVYDASKGTFTIYTQMPTARYAFNVIDYLSQPTPTTPTRIFYIVGGRTASASGATIALSAIDRLAPPMSIPAGTFNDLSQVFTAVTNELGETVSLPYILSMTTGTNQIDVTSPGSQAAAVIFTAQSVSQPPPPPPPSVSATMRVDLNPSFIGVGEQTQLTVTAVDSAGNVIKNYSGKARIQEEAVSAGAVTWDAMERTFPANGGGQVTFTGTAQSAPSVGGRYRLTVNDPGNTATKAGNGEVLVHGPAVTINIKVPNTDPKVGDPLQISLYYADAHGLTVNNFTGSATLSTNPPSVTNLDGVSVPVSKGSGTASGTIASYPVGGMLGITATDLQDPTLTGTTNLQVQHVSADGTLTNLRLDIKPSTATIGETVMLTVGAYDASGMLIPNFTGTLTVYISEMGVVPAFNNVGLAFDGTEGGQKSLTGVVTSASSMGSVEIKAVAQPPSTIEGKVVLMVPPAVTAPSLLTSFGTGDSGTVPISQGFSIVSGNEQSAPAGSTLPERFVVALRDVNGTGIPGQDVVFTLMSAEGRFENDGAQAIVQTDAMGLAASPFFVLSTTLNLDYRIQAAASTTLPLLDFKVHTTVQPGTPEILSATASLNPAPPGSVVFLTGSVTDKDKIGIPNQSVVFSLTSGEGQFEGGATEFAATTGTSGQTPSVSFTLGPSQGTRTVLQVSAPGLTLPPFPLSVWTTSAHLKIQAPTAVKVGETFEIIVAAFDAYDNPDGSVNEDVLLSDDQNGVTTFFGTTLSLVNGKGSATGSAIVVPIQGTVSLTASLASNPAVAGGIKIVVVGSPTRLGQASGNQQADTAGSTLPNPLAVVVYDANKNPVSGVGVTFSPVEQLLSLTPVAGLPLAVGRSNAAVVDLGGGSALLIGGVDGQMIYGVDWVNAAGSHEVLKLIEPRLNPQATRLPDNSILVTGGTDPATGTARDSAELIDNMYSMSVLLPPMNRARTGHVAVIVERDAQQNKGASVLITGGSGDASIEFYDPATKTFTLSTLEDVAVRAFGTATRITVNGNPAVLLAGGTSAVSQGALYFFKPAESIGATGVMMRPRINATATLLADGNVFFAGGQNGVITGSTERYMASMGVFVEVRDLLTPRTHHRAIPIADGKVLLVGGFLSVDPVTGPVANTEAEVLDIATGQIEPFDMPPELQVWDAAVVPVDANRVFVIGGRKGGASGPEASAATWTLTYTTASHAGVFVGHEAESDVTVPTTAAGLAFSPLFQLSSTPGENRVRIRLPDFPGVPETTFVLTGTEVVQPAAVLLTPFPSQVNVGDQLALTVTILGPDGMTLTNATGDVTLSTSSPGCTLFDGMLLHFAGSEGGEQTISSPVSFAPASGMLTVNAQLLSPTLLGTTTVSIIAVPTTRVTHLALTASKTTLVGNAGFTLTVMALDDSGMTVDLPDTVHLASSPPGVLNLDGMDLTLPPGGMTSIPGAAVDVTFQGTVLLTASVPTRPEIQTASQVFTLVLPANQVTSLRLALNPLPPFTLGQTFTLTITPVDANGNPIAPFGGTGRVSDTAGATSLVNHPFTFSQYTPPGGLTIPGTILAAPASGTSEFVVSLDSPVILESRLSFSILTSTDTKPPQVALSPKDGEIVKTAGPVLSVFASDESGIDTNSLSVTLDGADVTTRFAPVSAPIPPPGGGPTTLEFRWDLSATGTVLATGLHDFAGKIKDARGNPGNASVRFSVDLSANQIPTRIALTSQTPSNPSTFAGNPSPTLVEAVLLDQNGAPIPNYPTTMAIVSGRGRLTTLDGRTSVVASSPSPPLSLQTNASGIFAAYFYPSTAPGGVDLNLHANPNFGLHINVPPGPAVHYQFKFDEPHSTGPWAPDLMWLKAVDDYLNVVTSYTGTARIDLSGTVGPNGTSFPTPRYVTFTSADQGVVQIQDLIAFAHAGDQTLDAVDTVNPHINGHAVATIVPGAPSIFLELSGNYQIAEASSQVPFPFLTQVTDAYGNPNAGQIVTYARTQGVGAFDAHGSQTSVDVTTDANGVALAPSYFTGSAYGIEIVTAGVVHQSTLLPITFVVTVQDLTPPDAPTAPHILAATEQATLVWSYSKDPTANGSVIVTSYNAYRAEAGTGWFFKVNASPIPFDPATETVVTYVDAPVPGDLTYQYYVTAVDIAGNESAPSPINSIFIPAADTTPPRPPDRLAAYGGDTVVKIEWSKVVRDMNGDPETPQSYTLYRSDLAGGPYTAILEVQNDGSTVLVADDFSVQNGVIYYYVVTATDAAGNESGYSMEDAARPFTSLIQAPSLYGPSGVTVPVSTPTFPGSAQAGSLVRVFVLGLGQVAQGDADGLGAFSLLGSPLPDGSYTAYADAVDAQGSVSDLSPFVHFSVNAPPAMPVGLTVQGGDGIAILGWQPNGETDLAQYRVHEISPQPGIVATVQAGTTTYTVTGLANGTAYSFAVSAVDSAGAESHASSPVNVTPSVPATFDHLEITLIPTTVQIGVQEVVVVKAVNVSGGVVPLWGSGTLSTLDGNASPVSQDIFYSSGQVYTHLTFGSVGSFFLTATGAGTHTTILVEVLPHFAPPPGQTTTASLPVSSTGSSLPFSIQALGDHNQPLQSDVTWTIQPLSGKWSLSVPMSEQRSGHVAVPLPDGRVFIAGGRSLLGKPVPFAEVYDPATGGFSQSGNLLVPRTGAAACLLAGGRVVVCCGRDEQGALVPWSEVWDPATGEFSLGGLMIAPRENATLSPLPDGRAFVAGGNDDAGLLSSTEIFWEPEFWYGFPTLGAFVPGPSMTAPRARHKAIVVTGGPNSGAVLLVGGTSDGVNASDMSEIFVPGATGDTFSPTSPMIEARILPVAAALPNGRVLVFGGSPVVPGTPGWPAFLSDTAELFDTATGNWTPTSSLPFPVAAAEAVTVVNGGQATVVASGGAFVSGSDPATHVPNTPPLRGTLLYDVGSGAFRVAGSMRALRVGHTLTALPNGTLLAAGGLSDGQVPTDTAETFDLSGTTDTGSRFAGGLTSVVVSTDLNGISSLAGTPFDIGATPGITHLRADLASTHQSLDYYLDAVVPDIIAPWVYFNEPPRDAEGVSLATRVRIVLNEAPSPFSVPPNDTSTYFLFESSGGNTPAAELIYEYPNVLVIAPLAPLAPGTDHTYGVSPYLADTAGNLLGSFGFFYNFRTTEPPTAITALPGYDAAGAPLATIGDPFATPVGHPMQVTLAGPGGLPVAGWPVIFRVAQGGGTFFPSGYRDVTIATGQDGIASAPPFTLGSTQGSQTVIEAFPSNVSNPPLAQFALVTTTTSPRQFIVIPSTLSAAAGQPVSVTVKLVDAQGFTITSAQDPVILYASGTLAPNGSASSPNTLTGLSLQNGELTVPNAFTFYDTGHRVIACTLAANAFVFGWITVEVGPSVPTAMLAVGFGNGQSGAPGSTLAVPFSVFLTDVYANPVPAAPVRFSVIGGSASFAESATAGVTSNVQGVAASPLLTLDGALGPVAVRAEATGSPVPSIDFTVFVLDASTAPAVASVSPVDGALQAPVGSQVVIAFSAPMDLSTLNGGNIYLQSLGAVHPTSIGISSDVSGNTVVTLTPTTPLTLETVYSVTVRSAVTNVAGNPMAGDFVSFFTTQGIAPTVIALAPADGSGNVPLNAAVVATFSEAMNTSSIGAISFILMGPLGPVEAIYSYSVDVDGHTLAALRPRHQLALGTTYTASLTSGATDLAGTPLQGPVSTTFTTSASDASAPSVLSVVPASGAFAVPLDVQIVVTFDEDLNPATVTTTSVRLTDPSGSVVSVPASLSANVLTLNAAQAVPPLASTTAYTLTLRGGITGLADVVGNRMEADFVASFTTLDAEAPRVLSVFPPDTAQAFQPDQRVHVVFSEPMNGDTLTPATMYFQPAIQGTWSFTGTGTEAFFTPAGGLWPLNRAYTLTIEGANDGPPAVRDLAGIAMQQTFTSSFRTGRVLVTSPADGLTTNHTAIDILGLCDGSILAIEADGHHATMPGGTFAITGYPLTEGLNVISLRAYFGAANPEVTQFRVTRDTIAPRVVSLFPLPGETDVPITVVPVASFSEPVKQSTVIVLSGSPQSVLLSEVGGLPLSANRTLSADGTLVALQPNVLLGLDRRYQLDALATITDLADNPLVQPASSEFTTTHAPQSDWISTFGLPGMEPSDSLGHETPPPDGSQLLPPLPPRAVGRVISILAGDHQTGSTGRCAPVDLSVLVTLDGSPKQGIQVRFDALEGRGRILPSRTGLSTLTDASGRAAVHYHFGLLPGPCAVRASVEGFPSDDFVTFAQTAVSPTMTVEYSPAHPPNGPTRKLPVSEGFANKLSFPWRVRVVDPVKQKPMVGVKAKLEVGTLDQDGRFVHDSAGFWVMPEACLTDGFGYAVFNIVSRDVRSSSTVRISLPENPDVLPYLEQINIAEPREVIDASGEFIWPPLAGSRNIETGNAQVGIKNGPLKRSFRMNAQAYVSHIMVIPPAYQAILQWVGNPHAGFFVNRVPSERLNLATEKTGRDWSDLDTYVNSGGLSIAPGGPWLSGVVMPIPGGVGECWFCPFETTDHAIATYIRADYLRRYDTPNGPVWIPITLYFVRDIEGFVVGPPETLLAQVGTTGTLERVDGFLPSVPGDTDSATQYYFVERAPVASIQPPTILSRALDPCRESLALENAAGASTASIATTLRASTARFDVWASTLPVRFIPDRGLAHDEIDPTILALLENPDPFNPPTLPEPIPTVHVGPVIRTPPSTELWFQSDPACGVMLTGSPGWLDESDELRLGETKETISDGKPKAYAAYLPSRYAGVLAVTVSTSLPTASLRFHGGTIQNPPRPALTSQELPLALGNGAIRPSTIYFGLPEGLRPGYEFFSVQVAPSTRYTLTIRFIEAGISKHIPWNFWFYPFNLASANDTMYPRPLLGQPQSPLAKYDLHCGLAGASVAWEMAPRQANLMHFSAGGVTWGGHCPGGAWASALFDTGIPSNNPAGMGIEDVEALTTELCSLFHDQRGVILAGGTPSRPPPNNPSGGGARHPFADPMTADPGVDARDHILVTVDGILPATDKLVDTFHRICRDFLARRKKPFMADLGADSPNPAQRSEVWNHAVYRFLAEYERRPGDPPAVAQISNTFRANQDHFDPVTRSSYGTPETGPYREQRAVYVLEWDSSGYEVTGTSNHSKWLFMDSTDPAAAISGISRRFLPHSLLDPLTFDDVMAEIGPPKGANPGWRMKLREAGYLTNGWVGANPNITVENIKTLGASIVAYDK